MVKKIFLVALLIAFGEAFAQADYNTASFVKGLPDGVSFKWNKAVYAEINGGKFYNALFIVCKDTSTFINSMYIIGKNTAGLKLLRIGLSPAKGVGYSAVLNLKTVSEDELSSLNIKISSDKRTVSYRWGDSNSGYSSQPVLTKVYDLKPGMKFPSLTVDSPKGAFNIDSLMGKIVVINWWATGCMPCVKEIPGLNKLVEMYKGKPVAFISIVMDRENLGKFLKRHPFNYVQLYGNKITEETLGPVFPRNIILNKDHKIIYNELGGMPSKWKILDKKIKSIL